VLGALCDGHEAAQDLCTELGLMQPCVDNLSNSEPQIRCWAALTFSRLVSSSSICYNALQQTGAEEALRNALNDVDAEVRAAAVCAIGALAGTRVDESSTSIIHQLSLFEELLLAADDGSPVVRLQVLCAIRLAISLHLQLFCSRPTPRAAALPSVHHETVDDPSHDEDRELSAICDRLLGKIAELAQDPYTPLRGLAAALYTWHRRVASNLSQEGAAKPTGALSQVGARGMMFSSSDPRLAVNRAARLAASRRSMSTSMMVARSPAAEDVLSPPDFGSSFFDECAHRLLRPSDFAIPRSPKPSDLYLFHGGVKVPKAARFDDEQPISGSVLLHNDTLNTRAIALHGWKPLLVAAHGVNNTAGFVSCWDYSNAKRTNTFAPESQVSSVELIDNDNFSPRLLLGHVGGAITVWMNFEHNGQQKMVTAWNMGAANAPLIAHWMPQRASVLSASVGHGLDLVRVWDVHDERCVSQVAPSPTDISQPDVRGAVEVSSICADHRGQLIGIGRRDGFACVADLRLPLETRIVAEYHTHKGAVSSVVFQSMMSGEPILASCAAGGTVQLCDMRKAGQSYMLYRSHNIVTIATHSAQPILAVGSRKQNIKLYDLPARRRITVKAHTDFWGSRIGSVTCLRFHPSKSLLAIGASNDHLSVFSYDSETWSDRVDM